MVRANWGNCKGLYTIYFNCMRTYIAFGAWAKLARFFCISRAYLISDLICFGASPPGTIFDNGFQWPLKTDRFALMEVFFVFTDLIKLVHLLAFLAVHHSIPKLKVFSKIQYSSNAFIVLTDDFPITQPCLDRSFLWWTLSMRALVCNRPAGIF